MPREAGKCEALRALLLILFLQVRFPSLGEWIGFLRKGAKFFCERLEHARDVMRVSEHLPMFQSIVEDFSHILSCVMSIDFGESLSEFSNLFAGDHVDLVTRIIRIRDGKSQTCAD